MTLISVILVGILFAAALFLILQRNIVPLLFGFALFNHAANLFILTLSQSPNGKSAPIISDPSLPYVDPLPQALLLTAIVIGFGVTAYLIVLLYKVFVVKKTTDIKEIFKDS